MFSTIFLISITNVIAANNNTGKCEQSNDEECVLTHELFAHNNVSNEIDWNKLEILDLEEEVTLDFDTNDYLPENFNPLKGKFDLDWNKIELVELEEEVTLDFDTNDYLPENFNPLKGKFDLDWNKIELVELEEEVILDFDTKKYLPKDFNTSIM
jgi:hypothetical protein